MLIKLRKFEIVSSWRLAVIENKILDQNLYFVSICSLGLQRKNLSSAVAMKCQQFSSQYSHFAWKCTLFLKWGRMCMSKRMRRTGRSWIRQYGWGIMFFVGIYSWGPFRQRLCFIWRTGVINRYLHLSGCEKMGCRHKIVHSTTRLCLNFLLMLINFIIHRNPLTDIQICHVCFGSSASAIVRFVIFCLRQCVTVSLASG